MLTDPDPHPARAPAGEPLTCVHRALIVPSARKRAFAITDINGAPVIDATTFRMGTVLEVPFVDRSRIHPARTLKGRYLYAGDFWAHFGHFLFESLARLWALDHISEPLDGIIYLSHHPGSDLHPGTLQANILQALGIDLPVHVLSDVTEVEHLVVPRQGLGLGSLAAGTPSCRRFLQERLRKIPPRKGAERLYLSRAGYQNRRGGILAEHLLEANLQAQGYTVFSPEKHSFEDQIAAYLGAEKIIGPDSSALHLFGFVGRADQDLAIVLRRTAGAVDMLPQITGFTGAKPLVIDCIQAIWSRSNARISTWNHFAELDLEALGPVLQGKGFIDDLSLWRGARHRQMKKIRAHMEQQLGSVLTQSHPVRAAPPPPPPLTAESEPGIPEHVTA